MGQGWYQLMHESILQAEERIPVTNGPAQDATDNVSRSSIRGQLTIRDAKGHGAYVVGNHTKRDILLRVRARVSLAAHFRYLIQQRDKNVGVIVGLFALQRHGKTFKSHPCIDVLMGEWFQASIGHSIELHKNQIPNFHYLGMVCIDQLSTGLFFAFRSIPQVNVNFRTWTAWTGFPHFPKIILFGCRNDSLLRHPLTPDVGCILICFQTIGFVSFEISDIKRVFGKFINLRQKFPSPIDGFFFEVIPKRPIPQHFEHGVVVGVNTNLF